LSYLLLLRETSEDLLSKSEGIHYTQTYIISWIGWIWSVVLEIAVVMQPELNFFSFYFNFPCLLLNRNKARMSQNTREIHLPSESNHLKKKSREKAGGYEIKMNKRSIQA